MYKRWNYNIFFLIFFLLINSCGSLKELNKDQASNKNTKAIETCDTVQKLESLYITDVDALFNYDSEEYKTNLSLFYIPDSVIYITAVNAGFEILRAGIFPDSTIVINRLERIVYILYNNGISNDVPLNFSDFEILLNKNKVCKYRRNFYDAEEIFSIDLSNKDITKRIEIFSSKLNLNAFEFFHKKTGEYIIGEKIKDQYLQLYGNFLVGVFDLRAQGGSIEYNTAKNVSLSYNVNKYNIFYLE